MLCSSANDIDSILPLLGTLPGSSSDDSLMELNAQGRPLAVFVDVDTGELLDLVLNGGIYIAVAQVDLGDGPADGHAILWDAWRRILFLGPGDFNEHVCDGAILVDEEDLLDRDRLCDVYIGPERAHARMTLSTLAGI